MIWPKNIKLEIPASRFIPSICAMTSIKASKVWQKNAQDLWEKLADDVGTEFNIAELNSLRKHLICYQNENYNHAGENGQQNYQWLIPPDGETLNFQPVSQPDNLQLNGSIYPLRIHDTYAADLTLYYQNTVPVSKLKLFNPKGLLLANKIKTSLGQTLLLYAEPVVDEDYRTLADECVKAFVQDEIQPAPKFITEGQLFGSPIFEYDNRNLNPAKQCHILVWLKRHPDTLKLVTQTFQDKSVWLHLLLAFVARIPQYTDN